MKYMRKIGEDTPVIYDEDMFHPKQYEMVEPEAPKRKRKVKKAAAAAGAAAGADDLEDDDDVDALLDDGGDDDDEWSAGDGAA